MKVTSKVIEKVQITPEEKEVLMKAGQFLEDILEVVNSEGALYDAAHEARNALDYFMDKLEEAQKGD